MANKRNKKPHQKKVPKNDKFTGRGREKIEEGTEKPGSNDPAWYAVNSSMLTNAANINFFNPLGRSVSLDRGLSRYVVPGVMTFDVVPTIGVSLNSSSAVNTAAFKIYSFVRHENSGKSNYEAPDLMMYILAVQELYAAYTWCARLYGLAGSYQAENRYLPRTLVEANEVDFDSLINNLANFRAMMDVWAAKINSLCVPADLALSKRRIWMYSSVYRDEPTLKSQVYMFKPKSFLKFDGYSDRKGGKLIHRVLSPGTGTDRRLTISDIYNLMEELINPIIGDEGMNIMSGDILKAYKGNVMALGNIPTAFTIYPEYNAEVLMQINNMDIMATTIWNLDNWAIIQDPDVEPTVAGIILAQPTFYFPTLEDNPNSRNADVWNLTHLINMHHENPTPGDVMVATRLMFTMHSMERGLYNPLKSVGTEVIMGAKVWTYDPISGTSRAEMIDKSGYCAAAEYNRPFQYGRVASVFASHPGLWDTVTPAGPKLWDIDNFAMLEDDDLEVMHDCALMSLFGIADVASAYGKA